MNKFHHGKINTKSPCNKNYKVKKTNNKGFFPPNTYVQINFLKDHHFIQKWEKKIFFNGQGYKSR